MTTRSGLHLRITRLENDRDALYELIDANHAEVLERFAEVGARFEGIEATLVEVLRRLPEPA